jgi:hypothetical protein
MDRLDMMTTQGARGFNRPLDRKGPLTALDLECCSDGCGISSRFRARGEPKSLYAFRPVGRSAKGQTLGSEGEPWRCTL